MSVGNDLHRCRWQSICHPTQYLVPWWADVAFFHAVAAVTRWPGQGSKWKYQSLFFERWSKYFEGRSIGCGGWERVSEGRRMKNGEMMIKLKRQKIDWETRTAHLHAYSVN